MTAEIIFHDSTDPMAIPQRAYAALYCDGLFGPAGLAAARLFRHRRFITVTADWRQAGIIDYEPGNLCYEDPELVGVYLSGRARIEARARIYSDRSDLASAVMHSAGHRREWWIAAWSGPAPDFQPGYDWDPDELLADIKAKEGISIDRAELWGIQHYNGPLYDVSRLCGTW